MKLRGGDVVLVLFPDSNLRSQTPTSAGGSGGQAKRRVAAWRALVI